jgi:hypothetical protein
MSVSSSRRDRFVRSSGFVLALAAVAIAGLILAGCGERAVTTAPDGDGLRAGAATDQRLDPWSTREAPHVGVGRGFYPLAIGNLWHHRRDFVDRFYDEAGTLLESTSMRIDIEREIECLSPLGGRDYYFEHVTEHHTMDSGPETYQYWIAYRQDRGGLYEYESTFSSSPCGFGDSPAASLEVQAPSSARSMASDHSKWKARFGAGYLAHARKVAMVNRFLAAPGIGSGTRRTTPGPGANEILRLAYPLHPGAHWTVVDIGDGAVLRAVVEARDVIGTAAGPEPGWRIRYDWSGLLGPDDRVHVWYGPGGFLALRAHLVSGGTDDSGNPIGTVVTDIDERLVDKRLVGR